MTYSLLDEIGYAGFQDSEMKMPGLLRQDYSFIKYMLDFITAFNNR